MKTTRDAQDRGLEVRCHLPFLSPDASVDVQLPTKGISAVFGPSGAGKTSLLRIIAGLQKIPAAEIIFRGNVWQNHQHFLPSHRRPLAYVFQEASLFDHLSVRGNLEYGYRRIAKAERKIDFDEAVSWLGLENLLTHPVPHLSGGQRQRVAIARALLCSPELLLMDEPLASLDLAAKASILPYLEQLHEQLDIPIIYVSHDLDEVLRLADGIYLLDAGKIVGAGEANTLLTDLNLPLSTLDEAASVCQGLVEAQDDDDKLTAVNICGHTVQLSQRALPIGHTVRVRVSARDVSIALKPPEYSSIINILPARIVAMQPARDAAQILLRLDIGGQCILARITRRSTSSLKLEVGMEVFAQVKSVALL